MIGLGWIKQISLGMRRYCKDFPVAHDKGWEPNFHMAWAMGSLLLQNGQSDSYYRQEGEGNIIGFMLLALFYNLKKKSICLMLRSK